MKKSLFYAALTGSAGAISIAILAAVPFGRPALAQETELPEPYVNKRIVILQSTRNYDEALRTARRLAQRSQQPLKLRELRPHPKTGLSAPKEECENNGFGYPCYVARGHSDDGTYLSIEHSSAYEGFRPGYYIVVGASYPSDNAAFKKALAAYRKYAADAYAKQSRIYVGCLH